jgi:hypothetical protein
MSRARDDEMTFVLLGRDENAPGTILWWIWERVRSGKNRLNDPQILEAWECARTMEAERERALRGDREGRVSVGLAELDHLKDKIREFIAAPDGTGKWHQVEDAWDALLKSKKAK